MSVLRKIRGIIRKDRRKNVDILKELSIEKDIVDLLQVRRLTYFGHVNCMRDDRFPKLYLHGYTHGHRSRGRPKRNGWTISVKTVRTCVYLCYKHLTSPGTRHNGETLFTIWAAGARGQRHRRQGHNS